MERIKLHIDNIGYTFKPKEQIASIKLRTQHFCNITECSINELKQYIEEGKTISPAIMRDGCKAENWTEQQLFLIDIDNDNKLLPIMTINEAIKICKNNNLILNFYYESFSSTEEKQKYRLGFIFNEIIIDESKRKIIIETLLSLFNQSDNSTKNADRIFYGTNKEFVVIDDVNMTSFNDILVHHTPLKNEVIECNLEDANLKTLIENFDFLSYLKERNGEISCSNNKYVQFLNCELCNHQNDLTYYHKTKTFYCFSSSLSKGGTIIDYLMILNDFSLKEAIEYFKHTILMLPKIDVSNKYNENADIIRLFEKLKIENNYTFDDKGISQLFAETYKNFARFNTTANEWYYYNGKIWLEDERSMRVSLKAEEFADNLLIYGAKIRNEDVKSKFLKYVTKLGQYKYRETLVKDSKDIYNFSNSDLDKDDNLFNCQNGTYDLSTFKFREHRSDDMLSKISNVIYDPKVKAYRFERFIREVLEEDSKIEFVQKILGYSMTAETKVEACFIFWGAQTRNGKSTLIETFAYMLGNNKGYAVTASPETIALRNNKDSRAPSEDIARLNNCRFVSMSEPPKNMLIDNALLKVLTGRDTITARHLQQRQFEFVPKFKLFINTNHLPLITDETLFISNRIIVINFDKHFNEFQQDLNLKNILRTQKEISGIFNWCIEGLRKFNERNLMIPTSIIEANEKYRKSSDKIGLFIEDCLKKANTNIKAKDVYDEYQRWCSENGISCEGKITFIDYLRKREIIADTATINSKTEKNVLKGFAIKTLPLIDFKVEGI